MSKNNKSCFIKLFTLFVNNKFYTSKDKIALVKAFEYMINEEDFDINMETHNLDEYIGDTFGHELEGFGPELGQEDAYELCLTAEQAMHKFLNFIKTYEHIYSDIEIKNLIEEFDHLLYGEEDCDIDCLNNWSLKDNSKEIQDSDISITGFKIDQNTIYLENSDIQKKIDSLNEKTSIQRRDKRNSIYSQEYNIICEKIKEIIREGKTTDIFEKRQKIR